MGNTLTTLTGWRPSAVLPQPPEELPPVAAPPPEPKDGSYFGTFFFMGGVKFPALDPEAYLYGNMADLAFLPNAPSKLDDGQLAVSRPHATVLQAQVHVRRDTVRLSREEGQLPHVVFTCDSLVPCRVSVHMGALESIDQHHNMCFGAQVSSGVFDHPAGMGQAFTGRWGVDVTLLAEAERKWVAGAQRYPLVILVQTVDKDPRLVQSVATICSFEESSTGALSLTVHKQKFSAHGTSYMLQELYGIEATGEGAEAEVDEDQADCIVCMCEPRDTAVLPCRHLCLCHDCADVLRHQAGKCPICRAPFHSLLQMSVAKQRLQSNLEHAEGAEVREALGERYHCVPIVNSAQPVTVELRSPPPPAPPETTVDVEEEQHVAASSMQLSTAYSEIELCALARGRTSSSKAKVTPTTATTPSRMELKTIDLDSDDEDPANGAAHV